jgi:hypothetical protein
MSCAGKGYGRNPQSYDYLNDQFTYTISNDVTPKTTRKCRQYKQFYPSFIPILNNLSIQSSKVGNYAIVYVNGSNYLPNGTTIIKFGNYGVIPITYYSSFNLSFIVPHDASSGTYGVQVVNIYNGDFSPQVNQTMPGNLNYSKSINYTLT